MSVHLISFLLFSIFTKISSLTHQPHTTLSSCIRNYIHIYVDLITYNYFRTFLIFFFKLYEHSTNVFNTTNGYRLQFFLLVAEDGPVFSLFFQIADSYFFYSETCGFSFINDIILFIHSF